MNRERFLKNLKWAALFAGLFLLLPAGYFIWWNLPVTINRHRDIKFGEELIEKLEQRRKQKGLPETNDWQTLSQLGFKQRGDVLIPDYQKLNDTAFELVYLEGFDGPYLLWNSFTRRWKKAMPEHFREAPFTEEDAVSLVDQTTFYQEKSKMIDSLSLGERSLSLIVTLQDTVNHIYSVQGVEDNGSTFFIHFNFLVDVAQRKILNPSGKLEGQ